MAISEKFQQAIEPMNRVAAAVAVTLASVFMSGCADFRLNLPEKNVGGIPVGRVVNQSVNRDIVDAKKGVKAGIEEQVRAYSCLDANGHVTGVVFGDPRECDAYKNNGTSVAPRPSR